jgi:hypothetical protein
MEGRLPLNCANPGVKLKGFNQKEK